MRWMLIVGSFIFSVFLFGEEIYEFRGEHFIASYSGCDKGALTDLTLLKEKMTEAVNACGAQILDKLDYIFTPDGLTMVFLLSESHASIHTYPEYDACFVDLFTCGQNCQAEVFDRMMREYLQPEEVNKRTLIRHKHIEEN